MNINIIKVIVAAVLAVACIVALAIDNGNDAWASPVLALLVGYVVGNASVSNIEPIISKK